MNNVDFLITTLDRYDLLKQLIDSIYKFYPYVRITIADQSKIVDTEFYNQWKNYDLRVFPIEYDCGLSKARNILVEETSEPYKLILEDDFLFTEDTKIEKLLMLMDVADIAGGGVYNRQGNRLPFECYLEKREKTIYQVPDGNNWEKYQGIGFKRTGCIMNFFLAKASAFEETKWDENLKLIEHQNFFYRLEKEVVFTNDVKVVDNKGIKSSEYRRLRTREYFWKPALESLGANRLKYLNGQVIEIDGDKIIRYREKSDFPRTKN